MSKFKMLKPSQKTFLTVWIPVIVVIVGMCVLYHFIDPAPPSHLVMATGEDQSNYQMYAQAYKDHIKGEGITLDLRPSKGGWENLNHLMDPKSDVTVGFVQDGIGSREKNPGLTSLGSVYYEPVWIFYRGSKEFTRFTHFIGKKINMGERGGETHTMAKKLLAASGIDPKDAQLFEMSADEGAEALLSGKVDVAFFIGDADNAIVKKLILADGIRLMSLDQAEAIVRQLPYLHHLTLPHGTYDLRRDIPSKDIDLVAPTATLVANARMHPALVYLLLKTAAKVHRGPTIFEKHHEFPEEKDFIFPINAAAKNFYQSAAPWWLRYLPFWLATIVERLIFLVLPMLALVIPIVRLIPRYMQWRVRNKIYQRYGELKYLEDQIVPAYAHEKYEHFLEQLDKIEERVNKMRVPIGFSDYVYSLRGHIQFVRDRLERFLKDTESNTNRESQPVARR